MRSKAGHAFVACSCMSLCVRELLSRRMTDHDEGLDQVVILGAGRGVRGSVPSAIVDIDDHTRVMDWLLDAFTALDEYQVCFVGGFKADEVMERYPQVRTVLQPRAGPTPVRCRRSGSCPTTRSVHVRLLLRRGVPPLGGRRVARRRSAMSSSPSIRGGEAGTTRAAAADLAHAEKVGLARRRRCARSGRASTPTRPTPSSQGFAAPRAAREGERRSPRFARVRSRPTRRCPI